MCRSQVSWCCCMWVAMSERRTSGCVLKVIGWIWRMRRISAITAWRRQLLFVAGVSWHARPACSSVVEGGGMGQVGCVRWGRCCPWSVPIGVSWAVVVFGGVLVCVMGVVRGWVGVWGGGLAEAVVCQLCETHARRCGDAQTARPSSPHSPSGHTQLLTPCGSSLAQTRRARTISLAIAARGCIAAAARIDIGALASHDHHANTLMCTSIVHHITSGRRRASQRAWGE